MAKKLRRKNYKPNQTKHLQQGIITNTKMALKLKKMLMIKPWKKQEKS